MAKPKIDFYTRWHDTQEPADTPSDRWLRCILPHDPMFILDGKGFADEDILVAFDEEYQPTPAVSALFCNSPAFFRTLEEALKAVDAGKPDEAAQIIMRIRDQIERVAKLVNEEVA